MKNIAFLFGAGASIPAGMPTTYDISKEVFEGWDNWYFNNLEYWLKCSSNQSLEIFESSPYRNYAKEAGHFINLIRTECELYYLTIAKESVSTNYEEVFDVIRQLDMSQSREIDNPIIGAFLLKIRSLSHHLWNESEDNHHSHLSFKDLCESSQSFIKSVLRYKLSSHHIKDVGYFQFIKDITGNRSISLEGICTLNHDMTIERFFKEQKIEFVDGFQKEYEGVRIWNTEVFEETRKLILLKLHGSLRWSFIKEHIPDAPQLEKFIPACFEHYEQEDRGDSTFRWKGKEYYERADAPLFLTGTNDKYLQYQYGIFVELWNQYQRVLSKTNILICIGYGFGDNAVNARIINWMWEQDNRKLIVIDINEFDEARKNSRGAIHRHLFEWNNKRMTWITKNAKDLTADELLGHIL